MEDKSDRSLCKDDLSGKPNVQRRRSARMGARTSESVGGGTTSRSTNTSLSDQRASHLDFCEETPECIQIKEEYVSSEEEEVTFCGEDDEDMSSGEEGAFCGEGDEHTSSEEEDAICGGNKKVSSGQAAEQGTSRGKNIGNIEVNRRKRYKPKQRPIVLKLTVRRSKEISEDLRKQVVEAHKNGKGYKRIAKELDLHLSSVKSIVYKWKKFSTVATLPRSGRPTKIGEKGRNTILKHMRENTTVTAKGLKASLALDNINVHESTIRKTLSKWCSWDFPMEEGNTPQE